MVHFTEIGSDVTELIVSLSLSLSLSLSVCDILCVVCDIV